MITENPGSPSRTVWVVDDDETVLLMAEGAIAGEGFHVQTFADPQRALEAMSDGLPDVVVLDVLMPGMDGYTLCRRLRGVPGGDGVPVLMMTSLDDPVSISRAYDAGATDFVTKPANWNIETHRLHYMLRAADSERKLREEEREIRLAKEDWERTFNSIGDVVTVLDSSLRIQRANTATVRALGKPLGSIIGRHCYSLFQDAAEPCPDCPVVRTLDDGLPRARERKYLCPGCYMSVTAAPVSGPQGQVTHVVHIARDLSEQKLLEAEIRQAQKVEAVGTLAAGIAHDFNNVFQVVLGYGEMVVEEDEEAGRTGSTGTLIMEAAERGRVLTQQLLTFSRHEDADSGTQVVNLALVVEQVQTMLEQMLPKTVIVRNRLSSDLSMIQADAGQLEQVLLDLAVNAADAMPQGGTLSIEVRNARLGAEYCRTHPRAEPGQYVLLTVSDTGCGMERHTLEHMYDPFFTTKGVGRGTGLGLSVVFGIVKTHGGDIQCYSKPGLGTTFSIYFPVITAAEEPLPQPAREHMGSLGGSETLLIVDDEELIRNVVRVFLTKMGYTILIASDGKTALHKYGQERERIKLVVMDLGMPDMDGLECMEKMRQADPDVKVLVVTGYAADDMRTRAEELGAVGILHKSVDLEQLSANIRAILDASTAAAAE